MLTFCFLGFTIISTIMIHNLNATDVNFVMDKNIFFSHI